MSIYGTFKVYYDSDNDGVPELDISADVVSDITGQYGNFSSSDVDFLADTGTCKFDLNNVGGAYTDLALGRRVDIRVTDGTYEKVVFSGKIAPAQ